MKGFLFKPIIFGRTNTAEKITEGPHQIVQTIIHKMYHQTREQKKKVQESFEKIKVLTIPSKKSLSKNVQKSP